MCDCKALFEKAVRERTEKAKPKATEVRATVEGYGFNLQGDMKPALPVRITYLLPKAKGGLRNVTEHVSAVASFCPFCGERFPVAEA